MPSALICYFSGAGNTFRAAHLIGDHLKDAGYEVQIRSIEQGPTTGSFDLEVFAFPVYSFAPPAAMIRYLKSLPKTNPMAAVLARSMGSSSPSQATREGPPPRSSGCSRVRAGGCSLPQPWAILPV
jgi:flavodoxin